MKKLKKRQSQNTDKSTVTMTGILSLPLCIGEHAWIRTSCQFFTTSLVLKILEVSEDGIKFETCNTIYHLKYTVIPSESGVMCA